MKKKVRFYLEHLFSVSRFCFLLILLSTFNLGAFSTTNVRAQGASKLELIVKDKSLKEVFNEIERQSKVGFIFNNESIPEHQTVSLTMKGTLNEVLGALEKETNTSYKYIGKNVIVTKAQEQGTLKGTIYDSQKNPLPGANIKIVELNQTIRSKEDGSYSISLKPDVYSVEVSYLSFKTTLKSGIHVNEGTSTVLNFFLEDEAGELSEVVVTALGIKKETKKLGYAVQEIKSDKISTVPTNNFATQLSGKVAGLTVYNSPNLMQQTKMDLRGREPLVVIDGVPVNSNTYDINSMDIENITVLKGATAASLYGSKGQNGAIQITTKTGTKGTSVELSQRSIFRAGWIVFPETQTQYGNGEQGKYAYFDGKGNGVFDNDFIWGPKLDVRDPSTPSGFWETPQWDSPLDDDGNRIPTPFISRGKDNLKNYLETGSTISNNISVSTSGERTDMRFGLGYDYTNGEVPSTELKNYNVSFNVSSKVSDRLKLSGNLQYNRQETPNFPRINYGNTNILYGMLIWAGPDVDMRNFRNYWKPGRENYEPVYFNYSWINNPYYMAYEQNQSMKRNKLFGVASADYQFSKSLSFTLRQSAEIIGNIEEMQYPYGYIGANAIKGNYELNDINLAEYNTDAFLKYGSRFGKFEVNAFVGGSVNFREFTSHESKTQGLQVPEIYNLSNSAGPVVSNNSLTQYARNSLFASADLSWADTYFLTLTERMDVSSALPTDHNVYHYPSVSGSVVVSELLSMPKTSFLKVRGSWATVRADLAPYQYSTYYNRSITYAGNNSVTYSPILGNEKLKSQKTKGYEVGTNGSFFGGKLSFDVTAYKYVDSESIYDQFASLASGFSKYKINGNKFNRYGYEVFAGTNINLGKNIKWNSGINWSLNRVKLDEIDGAADNVGGIKVGERIDQIITNNTMRKTPTGELIIGTNGLPIRDTQLKSLGHRGPDWTASWSNNFQLFKHFDIGFLMEARIGGKDQANLNRQLWYSGAHPNSVGPERDAYNRGEPYVAAGVNEVNGSFVPNTYATNYRSFVEQYWYRMNGESNIFDLSFLKLREVSIGYTVPESFLNKLGTRIKSASFNVIGSNLFIISSFPLSDPDIGNGGTADNSLQFPSPRNIGFNLNVRF